MYSIRKLHRGTFEIYYIILYYHVIYADIIILLFLTFCRPVGQMIVSAAVIDDMIALVVLSQLEALVGEITVAGVLIPVISALLFLILGGYICVFVLPGIINNHILSRFCDDNHSKVELALMFVMLFSTSRLF